MKIFVYMHREASASTRREVASTSPSRKIFNVPALVCASPRSPVAPSLFAHRAILNEGDQRSRISKIAAITTSSDSRVEPRLCLGAASAALLSPSRSQAAATGMARDPAEADAELQALLVLLGDARLNTYLAVAGLTVVVYEHIASLGDEVELVWKAPLSWSNIFYVDLVQLRYFTLIIIRYVAQTSAVSPIPRGPTSHSHLLSCAVFAFVRFPVSIALLVAVTCSSKYLRCLKYVGWGQLTASTVVVLTADLVLAARVWILYHRSRWMLVFLLSVVALEAISMLALGWIAVLPQNKFVHVGAILPGCYPTTPPRLLTYYAIPPGAVALLMFLLTLYQYTTSIAAIGSARTPLLTLFLRDGTYWFAIAFVLCLVEVVIWSKARPSLAQIVAIPATGGLEVVAARVLLNLKRAVAQSSSYAIPTGTLTGLTGVVSSVPPFGESGRIPRRQGPVPSSRALATGSDTVHVDPAGPKPASSAENQDAEHPDV
ncbi:Ribosomal-protein-alanine acetyltransferase [Mycena chlorophos]|uniref:Ribosomal-protein-alanine acetyltransferase n=1 Tax=Mycena chlorophos TaxID=658473 RepID=A0A8H6S881_MYCCL|nr:Ribosomal-protein-alanine acetyltransferase [Mycena chlorophos]